METSTYLLTTLLVAFGAVSAVAGPLRVSTPTLLPDPVSPFAPDGCGVDTRYQNARAEPSIVVNPANPQNIAVAWIQDVAIGIVAAVTHDGGRNWRRVLVPGLSRCSGGDHEYYSDPWLSFGPDGTLYLGALAVYGVEGTGLFPGPIRMQVSRSADGGDTWSDPVFVTTIQEQVVNDKDSITAHPRRPGTVYAVWSKRYPDVAGALAFSRSTDSARTWSAETLPYLAPPGFIPISANLAVLDDDSLLMLFTQFPITDSPANPLPPNDSLIQILAIRSTDGGEHWTAPVEVGSTTFVWVRDPEPLTDPKNPLIGTAAGSGLPHIINGAVAPDGTVYVSWPEATQRHGIIRVARSEDRGATWRVQTAADINAPVFFAPIAAAQDGSVAVLFADWRNDNLGDTPLTTDVWLRRSRDRGLTWDEAHIGTYDLRQAYNEINGAYFVGDYESVAPLGQHGFAAAFGMTVVDRVQAYFASSAPPRN